MLLADVFERFIATCLKFYGLDFCHYFSSTGLSWEAMFKMTGVKLENTYLSKRDCEEEFLTVLRDTL